MTAPRSFLMLAALALVAACASGPAPAPPAPPPFNELGRPDAPVTILEFSDLQCRFCARHASQTFPQLRRDYVDTGKVRYVMHDLPLAYHANALPAAVAARCAGEQGRYWEYREALFAQQHRLGEELYAALAGELRLDPERFAACRQDEKQAAAVRADVDLATTHGINSTPSFVIGRTEAGAPPGQKIVGAKPYQVFQSRIEALLATPR